MVDQELDELKREFLAEAEEKVREMQSMIDGPATSESLSRVSYLAHQLKGSGGSYGYQRISADAAEIEKAIENAPDGDSSLAGTIRKHVTALRDEIERGAKELSAHA